MAVGNRRDVVVASLVTLVVPAGVAVAGMAVVALMASRPSVGWEGLGLVLLGMGVVALLAVTALVVTASIAFRRLPPGERWRPALAAVLGALVVAVALTRAPGGPIAQLCLLSLPVLLPLAVTGHARWRWVAVVVGAVVLLGLGDTALQGRRDSAERRTELQRFGDALPLTDGRSLDSPIPGGWTYLTTRWPYPGSDWDSDLDMQWRRGAGTSDESNYVVAVSTDRTDCAPLGSEPTCTVIGRGVHGDVTVHDNATRYVFVRVDDVEWRVETTGFTEAEAVDVLERLEAVDADDFVRVAERAETLR
ncbi:hypothetical protein OMK64_06630 [Cellulomonas fimi]|uniref:hypothetical protein n=1 Tax=Cellulomonas fimi TaxID=1708 RepID=UPI00234D3024|nr:hypothetical protein [Cellulomonas fimi]MDC7121207.1 hypothetical protein [Cellulomonas fimi]